MMGWSIVLLTQVVTIMLWLAAKVISPIDSWEQAAAQLLGLLGLMCLVWTFILATRLRIIEHWWSGLDRAYLAHHILGGLAFVALSNHVLFLIVGSIPSNSLSLYLIPATNLPYTLGILALYVMLFLLALTIYVRLPYRFWKWSHEWMGIVIILGGLHGILISSDTSIYLPLRYWVIMWSLAATVAFLYKRVAYYWHDVANYQITKSGQSGELLVLSLETSQNSIKFESGQFGFFSLPTKKREEHAFSILKSEGSKLIIGVKVVGDFTRQLAHLPIGTSLRVKGPYGKFGEKMKTSTHGVWVAGGIGITPFLSMAQDLGQDQKVEMYFCARVMPDSVITSPFEVKMRNNTNFRFLPCETSRGGRITGSRIFEETGRDKNALYLLCGPKGMMETIAEQLAQLGIKRSHIIYEDFAFK